MRQPRLPTRDEPCTRHVRRVKNFTHLHQRRLRLLCGHCFTMDGCQERIRLAQRRPSDPVCEQSIHRWDTDNRCRQRPFWRTRHRPRCLHDCLFPSYWTQQRLHRYCIRCIQADVHPLQDSDCVKSRGVGQYCHHPSRSSQHNHMHDDTQTKAPAVRPGVKVRLERGYVRRMQDPCHAR